MNNLRKSIQAFRRLKTGWQLAIFASLLVFVSQFSRSIFCSYCRINNQIREKEIVLQQRQNLLAQRTEISDNFDKIISKIEAQNLKQDLSLVADIEEVASHLGCKYELSNELSFSYDDIVISSVWVNLYGTNIEAFIQFCADINARNFGFGETRIHALKNDTLNIKCSVEAIKLVQR